LAPRLFEMSDIYGRGRVFGCSRPRLDFPGERHLRGGWPADLPTSVNPVAQCFEIIPKIRKAFTWLYEAALSPM